MILPSFNGLLRSTNSLLLLVYRFQLFPHTVELCYQNSLLHTSEELAMVVVGPLTLNAGLLLMVLIRWGCQQLFDSFPSSSHSLESEIRSLQGPSEFPVPEEHPDGFTSPPASPPGLRRGQSHPEPPRGHNTSRQREEGQGMGILRGFRDPFGAEGPGPTSGHQLQGREGQREEPSQASLDLPAHPEPPCSLSSFPATHSSAQTTFLDRDLRESGGSRSPGDGATAQRALERCWKL